MMSVVVSNLSESFISFQPLQKKARTVKAVFEIQRQAFFILEKIEEEYDFCFCDNSLQVVTW